MAFEVRTVKDLDEFTSAVFAIGQYFGMTPTEERMQRFSDQIGLERMHAAWSDGAIVGGAAAFTFNVTVPGGDLPTAGVSVVGVYPTHRRRGVLRSLMRAQLDDAHERGEPLAALWASEETIYGRFGYGVAAFCGEINLAHEYTAFAQPFEPAGTVRFLEPEEALDAIPPVFERIRLDYPGMFSRNRLWWEHREIKDPEERREGAGPKRWVAYEQTVDWKANLTAALLPPDHPLFLLLATPRRTRYRMGDGLWVRVVDVGAALSGRQYAEDGALVLDVQDDFCQWNEGRWRLEGGEAARTDAEPDLSLPVQSLGSALLGGIPFSALARAGRVEELKDGALRRADRLFLWDRHPWCPEIF